MFEITLSPDTGWIVIVGMLAIFAFVGAAIAWNIHQRNKLFMNAEIDRQNAIRRTEEIRAEHRQKEETERNLREMMKKNVISYSERYRFLKELSHSISSYPLQKQYRYTVDVSTRAQVDQTNAEKVMKEVISENEDIILTLEQCRANENSLVRFEEKIKDLPPCEILENPDHLGLMYMKTEEEMTEKMLDVLRPVVPLFWLDIRYASPGGRSNHNKTVCFTLSDMFDLLRQMEEEAEYKQSAQYQRSQVTESVRYNVMKRDGFRCTICGRDASDGVKLHIDHIIPVSKGGKSTMDNLRTLCEECNRGKRDKYDENGPN